MGAAGAHHDRGAGAHLIYVLYGTHKYPPFAAAFGRVPSRDRTHACDLTAWPRSLA
jgi:hypothetical protein